MAPEPDESSDHRQRQKLGDTGVPIRRDSEDTEAAFAPQPSSSLPDASEDDGDPSMPPEIPDTLDAPQAEIYDDALETEPHATDRDKAWFRRKSVRALLREYSETWGHHDHW